MRESIGGTMLFWIVLFFMSIFIAFMASVIKYARAYKIKNSVINYIEIQEGVSGPVEVATELRASGYPSTSYFDICIYRPRGTAAYYSLTVNAVFSIPIVSMAFEVPIRGETRIIDSGVTINSTENDFAATRCYLRCRALDGQCNSSESVNEG